MTSHLEDPSIDLVELCKNSGLPEPEINQCDMDTVISFNFEQSTKRDAILQFLTVLERCQKTSRNAGDVCFR